MQDLKDYNLAMLLKDLEEQVRGLKRVRISSIEASQMTDEVIDVIENSKIVVRHHAYSTPIRFRFGIEENAPKIYNGVICGTI